MTENVFKLIEDNGLQLHGDIEHFAELVRQDERGHKTPLKVLNLSVRAEHILKRGRVPDVETLRAMDARDILAIPDCGKKTLKEINEALLHYEQVTERKLMKQERQATANAQSHTWVGLTDKERMELAVETGAMSADWLPFMEAVEAKLKEKNT